MSIPPPPIGIPAPPGGLYPPPIRNGIATEVLLDRGVPLIDEVAEFIKQSGGPSLASILDSLRETAPAEANARERHAASQRAMASEILRYRSHVEAPAAAALRERKAASPSAVLEVGSGGRDSVVLAALEPDLTRLSCPPRVSSLALRVSPELSADAAHKYRGCALVAGADHNMIAMYVGPYRPGIPSPGFYLVYDSWANSLAAVPQLPSSSISWFSHRAVGSVAAVLRHAPPSDYILTELLNRNDSRGLPTNNATLCMWWSSGPVARRWILKEVVLPLPSSQGYTFSADTVFAAGYASLCWVDLLMGILMCEDMLAPDPSFRFIPLPEEYRTRPYPSCGRGFPEEYRSMSYNVDPLTGRRAIKFVNLDGYCQDWPAEDVMLTTWSLDPSDLRSLWHKDESFRIGDLMFLQDLDCKMPRPLVARSPLLSVVNSDIVYLNMGDEKGQIGGYNVVVERGMVVKLTEHSGSPHKFVSPFSMFTEETDPVECTGEGAGEAGRGRGAVDVH